jgi:hypothetical protein
MAADSPSSTKEFNRSAHFERVAVTTQDVRDMLDSFARQFAHHVPGDANDVGRIEIERRGADTQQALSLDEVTSDLSGRIDTVTGIYQSLSSGGIRFSVRITSASGATISATGEDVVTVNGLVMSAREQVREYRRWEPPEWAMRVAWALPALIVGAAVGSIAATDGDRFDIQSFWLFVASMAMVLVILGGLIGAYIYGKLIPRFELVALGEVTRWRKFRSPVLAALGAIATAVVVGVLLAALT